MRRSFVRTLSLIAVFALASACDDNSTTPTTPTTPGTITTESFEGTLTKNGATTFTLQILSSGTVTATLTAVAPDTTIAVGFSLGVWNGTACSTSGIFNDNALAGATILGSVSGQSTLCVRAYDVGKVVNPITFAIEVSHP
jgi:hypothetical protein